MTSCLTGAGPPTPRFGEEPCALPPLDSHHPALDDSPATLRQSRSDGRHTPEIAISRAFRRVPERVRPPTRRSRNRCRSRDE